MADAKDFPAVELSAVVVTDRATGRILLDYNERWQAFTLPMSKTHEVPNEDAPGSDESPLSAAVRAAAEVFGRPMYPGDLTAVARQVHWAHGGADGLLKRYTFNVFTVTVAETPHPLPGHVAVWRTRPELAEQEPISPTVAVVLAALPTE